MNKYGEIERFTHDNFTYIIGISKIEAFHLKNEIYVPHLYFHITQKSSKKTRSKSLEKNDRMYSLVSNTWNLAISRKIINSFRAYLESVKPLHISFSAYGDRWDRKKRLKFYIKRLEEMGYILTKINSENWDDYPVYYMERI